MRRCAAYVNNGRDPSRQISGYPFPGSNHRMTEFQAAILTEQFRRFKEQDQARQQNGCSVENALCEIPGLTRRKRYSPNTRVTYFRFEVNYDRQQFKNVPAAKFAEALQAEGIPMSGGPRKYTGGCHREGMLEEHLNSRGFQAVFSKARLDQYRKSLDFPVMDNRTSNDQEMLGTDAKIMFLGTRQEMDQIVAAFHKVARNLDQLTAA
jgi:dTDP-4-amino-4,6-dideoxygalactose transaminase